MAERPADVAEQGLLRDDVLAVDHDRNGVEVRNVRPSSDLTAISVPLNSVTVPEATG